MGGYQPSWCWAEEGAVPLNLANAQGDEGNAQASREHADLRDLEVLHRRSGASKINERRNESVNLKHPRMQALIYLREVRDETVVGGGAGDVEGEERPEALVGAASPHELLA